ncbi:hypothetical protein DM01DRAFT_1340249 [Hesseltinella vesiculosa]|uniref:RNI-like protein n=1 Tax=Hesseltinella vesiculosa TaxID=101127 RepID=A0A1X2G4Q2_9FUNG|nr:hypothetical protein DM01DRAFT_1340249 [Hesseltinella vesiculosa]
MHLSLDDIARMIRLCAHATDLILDGDVLIKAQAQLDPSTKQGLPQRDPLAKQLLTIFGLPRITNLTLMGPLPKPYFTHAILPMLHHLRCLDLLSVAYFDLISTTYYLQKSIDEMDHDARPPPLVALHQACPYLESLSCRFSLADFAPTLWENETVIQPWDSVRSLRLILDEQDCQDENEIGRMVALLCATFPSVRRLDLTCTLATDHLFLRDWARLLDDRRSESRLQHLHSLTLTCCSHWQSILDALHYFASGNLSSLTSLSLIYPLSNNLPRLDLAALLGQFPFVQHLHVQGAILSFSPTCSTLAKTYPLCSLRMIKNVHISQSSLDSLASLCPHLRLTCPP